MKKTKFSAVLLSVLACTSLSADLKSEKVTLKPNMMLKLTQTPSSVDSIGDAFKEGVFYGRLRMNAFYWDWQAENKLTSGQDNRAMGLGGSIVYKSASYQGVSFGAGLYTSQNPTDWRMEVNQVNTVKAGKDTFSRYDTSKTGNYGMSAMGQAYLQYDIAKTTVVAGRQLVESVFTKSNDTKMIPNTFDAVTVVSKDIPQTTIQVGYLAKQKLRDHTTSHDVIAFNGWEENDDAAVNKNLTVDRIGNDNKLIIASVTNKSIKNLKANVSYMIVPDVVSNLTLEGHYAIPISGDWKIAPGFRYMKQFDQLGADYGVANLKGNQAGYVNSAQNSLDSALYAVRLDIKDKAFLARFGYSYIANEADIIAPWRGFPTGGFTRAMAQYNWNAATKTYMVRAGYDFGKAGILEGFNIFARYAVQDFADEKDGVQADSNIIHVDAMQNIGKDMQLKFRMGLVSADDSIEKQHGTGYKADVSYNEYRVELNYFF